MQYSLNDSIPAAVFRTYDIRGPVAPDAVSSSLAYAIGLAFGAMAQEKNQSSVVVGRDGRLTGDAIQGGLIQGLLDCGVGVINIGVVSTPMLYYATATLSTQTGVMVTASHNPAGDNGFKLVLAGTTLSSEGIQEIYQRIIKRQFLLGSGELSSQDIREQYINAVVSRISLARPLKLVIDCGNGVGAVAGPEIFRRLGCDVISLYEEIDGSFPNHHPDPTVPKNLVDLIARVESEQADLGLAFDGDADRIGVVTDQGEVIWPDRQMMLFAEDVLSRYPGAKIIFDVKCSSHLPRHIERHGGQPIMFKTGHSLIKAKMKAIESPLAGEMSGHIFFNDDWFGFDDGAYVAARFVQILSAQELSASALFQAIPNSVNTPELKLPMAEERKAEFMRQLCEVAQFGEKQRITIDGLRVEFDWGWGLIRPSNTSAYLILRFEADDQAHLDQLQQIFRQQLLKLDATLELPF